jgi:hypothetical protein
MKAFFNFGGAGFESAASWTVKGRSNVVQANIKMQKLDQMVILKLLSLGGIYKHSY